MRYLMTMIVVGTVGIASLALSKNEKGQSPLQGSSVIMQNGIEPYVAVEAGAACLITNWQHATSDTSPKVITSYMKPPVKHTAAAGQIWFNASAVFINTPKVYVHPAEMNEIFSTGEWRHTNDWPMIQQHSELIYVRSIEKHYAVCCVRQWSGTTAYTEADSFMLVEYLTNNATLMIEK